MRYSCAPIRVGRSALVAASLFVVLALFGTASAIADPTVAGPVTTTTTLELNADGTGTVTVAAAGGTSPTNMVDLWVDGIWQRALTLTDGRASIELGEQSLGDHLVTVRYRPNSTTGTSQTSVWWTAPGTVQAPTTTKLDLNADGSGTVKVTTTGGATPTNMVDLWVDSIWKTALTLTNGQATIDLGPQAQGDHLVTVRYRPNSTTGTSQTTVLWTAPGTVQAPTTTKLDLNADGTGTVKVTTTGGTTPTNMVDLWVDSIWKTALTLTNGQATIDLGPQPGGDHLVTVRYRPNSTTGTSQTSVWWTAPGTVQAPTTTKLDLNADGTGTVTVAAAGGTSPTNMVDLWVDSIWKTALTLTNGQASIDLGEQSLGDHLVTVRYRPNSTTGTSQTSVWWTAPGTVQAPTTTKLDLNADGTGTVTVAASGGATPTNMVDLWVDSIWKRALTLTNGQATIDLGPQPGGDHLVTVRYRPNSTTGTSQVSVPWAVTTDDQAATTTTLSVLPDGTATVRVRAEDGSPTPNAVDLWVEGRPRSTHTLVDGQATVALGNRPGGVLAVQARYRPSATQQASTATAVWSVDTSPVPAPDECGEAVEKAADGELWTCTFADNFDGNTLDRDKWSVQTVFATGHEDVACYVDSPQNVSVSEGSLHLTLRKGEPQPCAGQGDLVTPYTSGMVTTSHKWSQQYGRFEARVMTTATASPGLHEAFWLWPDDRYPEGQGTWPANGEIDIAETYSHFPDLAVPFLHTNLVVPGGILSGDDANTNRDCAAQRGVFNTYTLEWSPQRVEVFVNGVSCLVNTSGNDAFKKRYIMALTQALGSQHGNTLVPETPIPATMIVDYVRAWS